MKKVGTLFRESLANRIKEGVNNNSNVFLLSYSALSGLKNSDLRKNLKKIGAEVYVTKNSIARLALKECEKEDLAQRVDRQTAFVFGNADSVELSKVLVDFEKQCDTFAVQGGLLEGKILDQADVKKLSELPSREVLLSMLLATIQSPLTSLAGALNAKTRELLSILKQLSEKNGGN
ncbi:50S ribosomal protein L10 [Candidatus Omnitrophota bacterium]